MDNSGPHSPIEALLAGLGRSKERFGILDCDRCVNFFELNRVLKTLNHGPHQWASHVSPALELPNSGRRSVRYLLIAYSNPDPTGLPNHLCFCAPIFFRRSSDSGKPPAVVCFAVEALTVLTHGLYWEDDRLVQDLFEDFDLFYPPLASLFWDRAFAQPANAADEGAQPGQTAIGGITYEESISALLWRWVMAEDELKLAIDPWLHG